ncbi:MAG: TolC family protein [Bacteroidales bacterium]|nr:TolC family protein [Bacteroidales bacterium]
MKKTTVTTVILAGILLAPSAAWAQYRTKNEPEETPKTETELILEQASSSETPVIITLEQALEIALSENVSVKVADMEIQRTEYAKKGSYASLFPQIDASGSYQRTIKKQVMYMDFDMSSIMGGGGTDIPGGSTDGTTDGATDGTTGGVTDGSTPSGDQSASSGSSSGSSSGGGLEVGRLNTIGIGVSASMPLVNAQLWKSLKISGMDVELAVEKARASRLDMVTQVKNAYFATLLAKEAFNVYKEVYENAVQNYGETEKKYNAQKASEMELLRAKTTVANAIPNVYNAESSVILALWQLKAVLGVDLDMNIDIAGALEDYSQQMFYDIHQHDSISLDRNTTMKQLAIQAEQLAENIKLQKYANIPSLAVAFNFTFSTMANDVSFSQMQWTPYSYVGLSLNIPIFAGGKRYQAIRQAKNQYQQVQLQTVNTERQLKIAIRQSLNTMETNMKSYYAAKDAVAAAQKGYDITEKSYQVGRSTLLELNDAQLALTQAKLSESQAIYNFVTAKAQLEQTLGQDFIQ